MAGNDRSVIGVGLQVAELCRAGSTGCSRTARCGGSIRRICARRWVWRGN